MSLPIKTEQIVRKLYSKLLYYKDGQIYFQDKSISRLPMTYNVGCNDYSSDYYIRSRSKDHTLHIDTLVMFNWEYPDDLEFCTVFSHRGRIELDLNEKLSDQSCMVLYEHNLDIVCKSGKFHYDRKSVERRYTIENIINHE